MIFLARQASPCRPRFYIWHYAHYYRSLLFIPRILFIFPSLLFGARRWIWHQARKCTCQNYAFRRCPVYYLLLVTMFSTSSMAEKSLMFREVVKVFPLNRRIRKYISMKNPGRFIVQERTKGESPKLNCSPTTRQRAGDDSAGARRGTI